MIAARSSEVTRSNCNTVRTVVEIEHIKSEVDQTEVSEALSVEGAKIKSVYNTY